MSPEIMGVKLFQIALQNPVGVYQAGDWVDGQVQLELDEPTKARGKFINDLFQLTASRRVFY